MSKKAQHAAVGISVVGALAFVSPSSEAHFTLQSPPAVTSQDALGSPQKQPPCGDEAGGTPTGTVTAYQSGQKITVTIDEKIFHPGHYRIALAVNDRSELPAEPPVTPNATPCGSVPVMDPPVFPVLADNVFPHTAPFSGPQSIEITLPADVTCTHCTLQVIEFMSNHGLNVPGGCFYHHCADISIQSTPVMTTSTGSGTGGAGGAGSGSSSSSGCSASPRADVTETAGAAFLTLVGLGLFSRRRKPAQG